MSNWWETSLAEVLQIHHGFAFSSDGFMDQGEHLILTPGNFCLSGGLQVRPGKERYFDQDFDPKWLLGPGDLVIAMTDLKQSAPILGSTARIPEQGKFLHNQRIGLVELIADKLDERFAYYLLNSELVRSQLRASATGSTVRHTAPARIESCQIKIPPIETQRVIGGILRTFDDLIQNNLRRIELLEEAVRLLYREWFVNFRYPGHEGVPLLDSDLGPIPEGFRRGCFGDLVRHVADWIEPQEIHREMPVMDLKDFPNGSTTLIRWGYAKDISSRRAHFQEGDVLFGKLRPYFHKVLWAPFDGVCTPSAFVFRAQETVFQTLALSVASSKHFVDIATGSSTGTTMPSTPIDVLLGYPLAIPPTELIVEFDKQIRPLVTTCSVLAATVRGTEEIRDLLLPRLVSGDLDVSDLDLGLEAVS